MKIYHQMLSGALLTTVLAGCAKQAPLAPPPPPPVVPELTPQQRTFQRVNRELETGGTVYAYLDIAGDDMKVAHMLQDAVRRWVPAIPSLAPLAREDLPAMARTLGLDDVKAMGLSSVPKAGGFSNRAFLYTPSGRHGLTAIFGGPAGPLRHLQMAPAAADFYVETEFDLTTAYRAVREFVAQYRGNPAAEKLDQQLSQPNVKLGFSALELILALKGRLTLFGRIDAERNYLYYGAEKWRVPRTDLLLRIDGIGALADRALKNYPDLVRTDQAGRQYYRLRNRWPVDGLDFVLVIDGSAFYLATSGTFFEECLHRTAGLDQNPEFAALLAALGPEASAVSYATPHLMAGLNRVLALNAGAPEKARTAWAAALQALPSFDRPVMAVRQNLPDGILLRSRSVRSLKKELIAPLVYGTVVAAVIPFAIASRQAAAAANPPFGQNPFGSAPAKAFAPRTLAPPAISPMAEGAGPDRGPTLLASTKPIYPLDLRYRGGESVVMVEFVVAEDGTVERPRVIVASDPAFASSALAAVRQWRFRPRVKAGRVASTDMMVPVVFSLSGQDNSPEPELADASIAISSYYSTLLKAWDHRAAKLSGLPKFDLASEAPDGLIWARIGLDDHGAVVLEQAGHGPADPGATELSQTIRQSIAAGEVPAAIPPYLKKVGYVDIGLPSIARLVWKLKQKAFLSPIPTFSPP